MTEKRFNIHSMLSSFEIGENIDLDVLQELIEEYGSSARIELFITDNGKNMTYQEVSDLLNNFYEENQRLKCINKQLEERLGRSLALDMEECE